jgi:heme/copper-type cytochrome/quinol oxidase subunit 2
MALLELLRLLLAGLALLALTVVAVNGVTGYCAVRIRPTRGSSDYTSKILHLREVEIYDISGTRINLKNVVPEMS